MRERMGAGGGNAASLPVGGLADTAPQANQLGAHVRQRVADRRADLDL